MKLPEHLRLIYFIFYISQLEPVFSSTILNYTNLPLPLIKIDKNLEFEVVQILDLKLDKHRINPLIYNVCWIGYKSTSEEYLWLNIANLTNTNKLLSDFHTLNLTKPGSTNALSN